MKNFIPFLIICSFGITFCSCSKKSVPHTSASAKSKTDSANVKNAATKKIPTPKVIVVNDAAAQKTVDGRNFYDLNGKRYWKNYKDGKYYLFNKSMYNNPDFKPQP